MAKSVVVIAPTTDAVTVQKRMRITTVPATLIATNLAGAEAALIFFSVDDGGTWEALSIAGSQAQLTADDSTLAIYSPMLIGVTKSATVAASGVYQN